MIPIMLQNAITNFVNMLDNIMVGRIGTLEMTGVSVANDLLFVFNLSVFGAVSGAGIFGAQFYGNRDHEGVRHTFRLKNMLILAITVISLLIFAFFKTPLISLFLKGEGTPEDAAAVLEYAGQYINIIMIGLIPYGLAQCLASTLRETDEARLPMLAGIAAVCINLFLNYVLIYGHFGAPALGVRGAAIATVISRYAELAILLTWTLRHTERNPFIIGAFSSLYVPRQLMKNIIIKGVPLMLNECLWSLGMVFIAQSYSLRGLHVVSANTITNTFFDVFNVAVFSSGVSMGILIGQMLGANRFKEAVEDARKMSAFGILLGIFMGGLFALCAEFIPAFYNTTEEVRELATGFMLINAMLMPLEGYLNSCYFIIRSGGQTLVTMAFDSGFVWAIQVPAAILISRFTSLPIVPFYLIMHLLLILKTAFGVYFMKKKRWVRNITV